jgi:hypothetical protein
VSGLVLTVHATCANVVGKVTIGLDVPPPPTILVGKELRPRRHGVPQVRMGSRPLRMAERVGVHWASTL